MGLVEVGASGEEFGVAQRMLRKRVCVSEEKEESSGRGKVKDTFLIDVRWPKG